ncbi:MAG: AbrB/MazE/SpoVT family DNA-binding domain-containing protein [Thermoanaerobaculia bacterium]
MRTTIDAAGRVVIPKALRDRLGLLPGGPIEVSEREGKLEIESAPTPMKLTRVKHGAVAVPESSLPPLTDDLVRETLDRTRR